MAELTERWNGNGNGNGRLAPATTTSDSLAWLSNFAIDAQNIATPLGAFLAALPKAPKRRVKSSAERGKAFRNRQRLQESHLQQAVDTLHSEIETMEMQRRLWEIKRLHTRTSASTSSLVRAIYEYHALFQHGLQELPPLCHRQLVVDSNTIRKVNLQEEFIRRMFDGTAVVGNTTGGPEASIIQWRMYTKSHAGMTGEVTSVQVISGSDTSNKEAGDEEEDHMSETVLLVVHCWLHVRFSRETFTIMFPHVVASNQTLVQKMIGKEVSYSAVKHFEFARDGKIICERVSVDFVGGLLQAGCTLEEIAQLMGGAAISTESMLQEEQEDAAVSDITSGPQAEARDEQEEAKPSSSLPVGCAERESNKLDLAFLLSDM